MLWKVNTQRANHFFKWIPWRNDSNTKIEAISFQSPSSETVFEKKIQLLIASTHHNHNCYVDAVSTFHNFETINSFLYFSS